MVRNRSTRRHNRGEQDKQGHESISYLEVEAEGIGLAGRRHGGGGEDMSLPQQGKELATMLMQHLCALCVWSGGGICE